MISIYGNPVLEVITEETVYEILPGRERNYNLYEKNQLAKFRVLISQERGINLILFVFSFLVFTFILPVLAYIFFWDLAKTMIQRRIAEFKAKFWSHKIRNTEISKIYILPQFARHKENWSKKTILFLICTIMMCLYVIILFYAK